MNEIIILDIETTGFSPADDMIVELGMVKLDFDTGKCTALFDRRFKELNWSAKHEKAWIFEQGYMKPSDLDGAKPLKHSIEQIKEILAPYKGRITAWNSAFDFKFLEYHGIDLSGNLPCPMQVSTSYFKIPNARGGYKWPKAQEAYDVLFPNEPYIEKHRGFDDAVFEAKIIFDLYHKGIYRV